MFVRKRLKIWSVRLNASHFVSLRKHLISMQSTWLSIGDARKHSQTPRRRISDLVKFYSPTHLILTSLLCHSVCRSKLMRIAAISCNKRRETLKPRIKGLSHSLERSINIYCRREDPSWIPWLFYKSAKHGLHQALNNQWKVKLLRSAFEEFTNNDTEHIVFYIDLIICWIHI